MHTIKKVVGIKTIKLKYENKKYNILSFKTTITSENW